MGGRYGKELGALGRDPAGKYLDSARQARKALGVQAGQERRPGSSKPSPSSAATRKGDVDDRPWRPIYLPTVVREAGAGKTAEQVIAELFTSLQLGGRLAFKDVGKDERGMIHDVAHRMPGLWKKSCADPDGDLGARMVCIERIQPATTESSESARARPLDALSKAGMSAGSVQVPLPDATKLERSSSGADCSAAGACSAHRSEAEAGSAGSVTDLPRKGRWRRSPTSSDAATTGPSVQARWGRSAEESAVEQPIVVAPSKCSLSATGYPKEPIRNVPAVSSSATASQASAFSGSVCIVWLRDDMRLQDNPALLRAVEGEFDAVVPVFIDDVEDAGPYPLRGAARVCKNESLRTFAAVLRANNSRLVLRRAEGGNVVEELLRLLKELGPASSTNERQGKLAKPRRLVTFNRRYEPHLHAKDEHVVAALRAGGVSVETFAGNVLYEPQDLQPIERWQRWRARVRAEEAEARGLKPEAAAEALSGKPKALEHVSGFGSYRFFSHALEELGPPQRPCATVRHLPVCPPVFSCSLEFLGLGTSSGRGFPRDFRQHSDSRSAKSGYDWASEIRRTWTFGEAAALRRLDVFLETVLATGDFEGRKRLRSDQHNTSELSPYIRFGELSARTVYWAAKKRRETTTQKLFENSGYEYTTRHGSTYKGNQSDAAKANSTFIRRFVWRDLAYWFLWEFPDIPKTSLRPQYETQVWTGTRLQLRHWQRGTTGFPLVDAAMRQLWAVGWMPNYLRHVVAQTLIEYLDLSWKDGLQWFDYTLVDMDLAINSFMWQNGGHSGPDHWEFVLHPVNAAKSCDPDGNYVRQWLPFLAECPTQYIHCPWNLPARIFRMPPAAMYTDKPLIADLDEARRAHFRRVLEVRRTHPEMVSRTGHEWLKLPGRGGLLAKCVTRQEFRAETEDFLLYQGPQQKRSSGKAKASHGNDASCSVLCDMVKRHESGEAHGPGL